VSDPSEKLEAELARMRPIELPTELMSRIEESLNETNAAPCSVWPDRMLIGSMICGGIAACIIAWISLAPVTGQTTPIPSPVAVAPAMHTEYPLAWANGESEWLELLK
jgi:hypothetical protein